MAEHHIPTFMLVLVGDHETGKTAFIKRHMTGEFEKHYKATIGTKVYSLKFHTTRGPIIFHVWDTARKFGDLPHRFYIQAHCAIIFYDVTTWSSYNSVPHWQSDLGRICCRIPVVLCANKMDIWNNKRNFNMEYQYRKHLQYFPISVKSKLNLEKPFLWLARALVGDNKLEFVESPAILPPAEKINQTWLKEWDEEIADATEFLFLEEDDTDL